MSGVASRLPYVGHLVHSLSVRAIVLLYIVNYLSSFVVIDLLNTYNKPTFTSLSSLQGFYGHSQPHALREHTRSRGWMPQDHVIEIGRFRVWLIVGIDGLWHDMQFIPNTATFRR